MTLFYLIILITEEFCSFCDFLNITTVEEIWSNAFGRYDRAMQRLLEIVLGSFRSPIKKLVNAVVQMKTPKSSKHAADAIQKGYSYLV